MTPQACIDALDRSLAAAGQEVVLRRIVGDAPNTQYVDCNVRATIRYDQVRVQTGGASENISVIIISPTDIARAQWPGGELPTSNIADPTMPRRDDKILANGSTFNIEQVKPFIVDGVLVRIELRTAG